MKKAIFLVFLSICLISSPQAAYAAESEDYTTVSQVGFLVEMLVENDLLTQEQAQKVIQKAKRLEEGWARARQKEIERVMSSLIELREQEIPIQWREQEMPRQAAYLPSMQQWREQEIPMDVSWEDGIRFKSHDGDFETKIGGRIFADMLNTYSRGDLPDSIRPSGDFNNRNDQAYIPSARLNIEGTMYEDYFYSFEYEFNGEINTKTEVDGLRDMYLGMKDIPYLGRVSVGHMKEPFSLEESTSSSKITFLERSLANVFAPGFSWGVGMQNEFLDDRVTFGLGMFLDSDSSATTSYGNAVSFTTRVTGLPWYGEEDKLLHLGTSYSYRNPKEGGFSGTGNTDGSIRFRQRPELSTRDFIVDTGALSIDGENRLGFEAAFVYGPFSLQGELIQTWLDPSDSSLDTGHLYGGYGSLSYLLTGEHRRYDKNDGRFQGVIPNENFSFKNFSLTDRTWGAWEIALRWSYLSLEDRDMAIEGGETQATTVGLNWYLNPNMRVMLNWVRSKLRGTDGSIDGIQVRAQVTF